MKTHEILGFAVAFVGGFGGLAGYLPQATMIDALNELRPPEGQVPPYCP
jgi:hypothetical protein